MWLDVRDIWNCLKEKGGGTTCTQNVFHALFKLIGPKHDECINLHFILINRHSSRILYSDDALNNDVGKSYWFRVREREKNNTTLHTFTRVPVWRHSVITDRYRTSCQPPPSPRKRFLPVLCVCRRTGSELVLVYGWNMIWPVASKRTLSSQCAVPARIAIGQNIITKQTVQQHVLKFRFNVWFLNVICEKRIALRACFING